MYTRTIYDDGRLLGVLTASTKVNTDRVAACVETCEGVATDVLTNGEARERLWCLTGEAKVSMAEYSESFLPGDEEEE